MKVQKNIEVWLVKKRLPRPIDLVQYDTGIQLVFALQDFAIPGGTTATLYVQKPSGKFVYQETGIIASANSITIDLENQAITEHGNDVPYQVRLLNGTDLITTFAGIFRVEKSLADANAVESKTVVAAFEAKTAEQLAKIEAETLNQIALVQAASQTEQEAIENKGLEVLNTIPADYTATVALADQAIREKGSAIVCEAKGEVITVADASDDPLRGLKLFGKTTQKTTTGAQKLPYPYSQTTRTTNGITFTDNGDGSITISGTATANAYLDLYNDPSPEIPGSHFLGGVNSGKGYKMYAYTGGAYKEDTGKGVLLANGVTSVHITVATGSKVNDTLYPMLSEGDTALPWECYSGGAPSPSPDYPQELNSVGSSGSIIAKVAGVNLFDINSATFRDGNGLTGTINADGSITVNGTPTGNYAQVCSGTIKLPKGKYFVSGGKNAAGCAYFQLYANKADGSQKYAINGVFEVDGTEDGDVHYSIQSGNVLDPINNYTLFPMFNVGEVQKPFEPYKSGGTVTASTPNGLPGIPVSSGGNYTDASGQQWICDEVDLKRGVYVQRVNEHKVTGTEAWSISAAQTGYKEGFTRYDCTVYQPKEPVTVLYDSMWSHFPYKGSSVPDGYGAWVYRIANATMGLRIVTHHETVDSLKSFLTAQAESGNPVTVRYIIRTPIETALTAEEIAAFKALHSNKPNTTVCNDSGAHMALEYNADTKTYIDSKFAELAAAIVNNA